MQEVNEKLLKLIFDAFGIQDSTHTLLGQKFFRFIYKCKKDNALYTLRVFTKDRPKSQIEKDIALLEFLNLKNFPSTKIIKANNNETCVSVDNVSAILTTYIEGNHPALTPVNLFKIGELAGNLHSLDCNAYPYESAWSPQQEIFNINNEIKTNDLTTINNHNYIPLVIDALSTLPSFEKLPQVIIHSDIHTENTIVDKEGKYYFIDWDDAGRGTAILDLGYTLSQVCITFENNSIIPVWRPELAKSFLDGYQSIRKLTDDEKNNLVYAMQFSALDYTFHYYSLTVDLQNWARYEFAKNNSDMLRNLFLDNK